LDLDNYTLKFLFLSYQIIIHKIKKKLQKALKITFEDEFFDNFEKEISKYNYLSPIKEYN
jgi:hypothetical protein